MTVLKEMESQTKYSSSAYEDTTKKTFNEFKESRQEENLTTEFQDEAIVHNDRGSET